MLFRSALKDNHLTNGQNLLIPVSTSKLAAVQSAYVKTASVRGDNDRAKIVHRVSSGESLWSIAKKYKVYVHQLREWNLLETDDVLRLGQRLFI